LPRRDLTHVTSDLLDEGTRCVQLLVGALVVESAYWPPFTVAQAPEVQHTGMGTWLEAIGIQASTSRMEYGEVGARHRDSGDSNCEKVIGCSELLAC
jgi:hypothetical protein